MVSSSFEECFHGCQESLYNFSHVYVLFPSTFSRFLESPFCHCWMNQLRYPKAHGWRSLWRSWVLSRCKSLMAPKMANNTKQNWRISLDREGQCVRDLCHQLGRWKTRYWVLCCSDCRTFDKLQKKCVCFSICMSFVQQSYSCVFFF